MTITNPTAQVPEQPDAEPIAATDEPPLVAVLRGVQAVVTEQEDIYDEWSVEETDPTDEQRAEMGARFEITKQLRKALGLIDPPERTTPRMADICPGCGYLVDGRAARSRFDNETRICTPCGMYEALADLTNVGLARPGVAQSDSGLWTLHLGVRLEHLSQVGGAIVYWREAEDLDAVLYLDEFKGDGWTTWGRPAGQDANQAGIYHLTCDGGETPEAIMKFLTWFMRAYPDGELLVDVPDTRPGTRTDLGRPIAVLTDRLDHTADDVVIYQHADGLRIARPSR